MPSFVVVLDLKHGDDKSDIYRDLYEELSRLNGFRVEPLNWLVDVRQNATQLENHLRRYFRQGDAYTVTELTRKHRFCTLSGLVAEWIRKHPPLR